MKIRLLASLAGLMVLACIPLMGCTLLSALNLFGQNQPYPYVPTPGQYGSAATITPTPTPTATATATATSPTPATLLSLTQLGNAAVTSLGTYTAGFFTAAADGDISNNAAGVGSITPISTTSPINISVQNTTDTNGRPQVQIKDSLGTVVYTVPVNTTSATLTDSGFTPTTTNAHTVSIIDTGVAAGAPVVQSYTILITQ